MFKKIHYFTVAESRLVRVLKILDTLGVKVNTVKDLNPECKDRWYVSVYVNRKQWDKIKNAIYEDPQIGGACSDFN